MDRHTRFRGSVSVGKEVSVSESESECGEKVKVSVSLGKKAGVEISAVA